MTWITLHELPAGDVIELNAALIFSLKAKGRGPGGGVEGTVVNGQLTVGESLAEIRRLLPKAPAKKVPTY